jgi:hypothetical protein
MKSKQFFFEKKNQKTFGPSASRLSSTPSHAPSRASTPKEQSFFAARPDNVARSAKLCIGMSNKIVHKKEVLPALP